MTNAAQKRKLQAWFAICLLVVCAAMPQLSYADQKTYEGTGWDTPEDAVLHYLDGLKEQDIGKMISAYAVETCIDHFDLKAQLARIGVYTMSMTPSMPNSGNLLRGINIETRKNQIVQSILWQITAICLPGQDFSQPIPLSRENDGEAAAAFVEGIEGAFDAVDFGTLTFLRFTPPEQASELYASERNQENIKEQIAPYGAEEARSVIAHFIVGENFCAFTCDAIRYGDRRFMHQPGGNIGVLVRLNAPYGMISVPKGELVNMLGELDAPIQDIINDFLGDLF